MFKEHYRDIFLQQRLVKLLNVMENSFVDYLGIIDRLRISR